MKKIITTLICIFIIGLMGCNQIKNSNDTPQKISNGNGIKSETKDIFAIGEEVKLNNTTLTVNNVERSQGSDYDKPKDGQEFVIINVTIKNTGNKDISYNPYNFKLQNSQGNITNITFTTVNTGTILNSGELASGGTVSGTLAFETTTGDKGLILKYNNNVFSNKEIKVKIDQ